MGSEWHAAFHAGPDDFRLENAHYFLFMPYVSNTHYGLIHTEHTLSGNKLVITTKQRRLTVSYTVQLPADLDMTTLKVHSCSEMQIRGDHRCYRQFRHRQSKLISAIHRNDLQQSAEACKEICDMLRADTQCLPLPLDLCTKIGGYAAQTKTCQDTLLKAVHHATTEEAAVLLMDAGDFTKAQILQVIKYGLCKKDPTQLHGKLAVIMQGADIPTYVFEAILTRTSIKPSEAEVFWSDFYHFIL